LVLNAVSGDAVINLIFKIAGFTYGPLLGLFLFGLFTDLKVRDRLVLYICLATPFLTWAVEIASKKILHADIGFLTILVNGGLTFFGLWAISYQDAETGTMDKA
jgi:hypothetical protein